MFNSPGITARLHANTHAPGLVLALAAFLTQFDVTAVVVAMPLIGRDLELGIAGFAWVMDAYSLSFTAALLAAGALSDRFGRRRAMLAGNMLFMAASLACGLAWDGPTLWAARALQGFGAAFAITGAIALLSSTYSDPQARAHAFGRMGLVSGIAMALGPTLGGAIADWLGWRWIFLANVPLCLLVASAVPRLVEESRSAEDRSVDVVGIGLLTLALGLIIASLLQAHAFTAMATLGAMASVILIGVFVIQQRRAAQPLFDVAVFARPAIRSIAGLLFAVSFGYWAVLVYLPLFLQSAFGWQPGAAGLGLLAATAPMLVLPAIGGHLAVRWGLRRLFAVGLAAITSGDLCLAAACVWPDNVTRLILALLGMTCIGIGAALAHPQLSGAIVALVPTNEAGMASAVTIAARQAGFAIGIAALAAVLDRESSAPGFVSPFLLAAIASAAGLAAALSLLALEPVKPLDR